MGKIFSSEILFNKELKYIKTKKNSFPLQISEKGYISSTDALSGKNIYLSYPEFEFEVHKVFVPSVKDLKTKEIIIRKTLDLKDKDLIIHFIEQPEIKQDNKTLHYVYVAKLFPEKIEKVDLENIKVLTFSQISVFNFSYQVLKDKYIYHCFADEEKLILTISKGNILFYARILEIPEHEKKDPINFFYENINLTYHYILQNKVKSVDLILLSGELFSSLEIGKLVYEFSRVPVATIYSKSFVKNIEPDDFHNFLIPIGNLLTEDTYNFLPDKVKEEQTFKKLVSVGQITIVALLLIFVFLNIYEFSKIEKKLDFLESLNNRIIKEKQKILRLAEFNVNDLSFYENYLDTFFKSQDRHPLYIASKLKPLLSLGYVNKISIREDKENYQLVIDIELQRDFHSLSELDMFKKEYKRIVLSLSEEYTVQDNTTFDFKSMEVMVKLNLSRPI